MTFLGHESEREALADLFAVAPDARGPDAWMDDPFPEGPIVMQFDWRIRVPRYSPGFTIYV